MKSGELGPIEREGKTLFKDAVLSEAEAKSMELVAEANKKRTQELEQAQQACEMADYAVISRRLAHENERAYSSLAQNARRELLGFREKLVARMFAEIEKRLVDFASGDEYASWLVARLLECCGVPEQENAGCYIDAAERCTVYLRQTDSAHAQVVKETLPGCAVEYTSDILLGGLQLWQGNYWFDKTLDGALETEKQRFYETSGLTV